uniref:dolichyl-phosphate-mannose--protein mannosyltransferase n=2 Tax=Lygus hesperus TaxID=30085 RepID=A0A0A9XPY3_LYGHE
MRMKSVGVGKEGGIKRFVFSFALQRSKDGQQQVTRTPMAGPALLVCLAAVAVYHNTLDAGFVYDDSRAILSNPDVVTSSPITEMWKNDFWGTPLTEGGSHGSYRPLCVLSFRVNYWACGLRPLAFHAVNVALHGLASGLVYRTAKVLGSPAPTATALLFAVHPVHTEAVSGVVGRADVLSTIFFLLSFLTYTQHVSARRARRGEYDKKPIGRHQLLVEWVYLWASLGLAACAMLCKETGITVLALSAIYDTLLHRQSLSLKLGCGTVKSICWLSAGLVVLMACRLHLMGLNVPTFASSDNPTARCPSFLTRLFTFAYLPAFNGLLLIFPRWLSFDWGMEAIPRITSVFDSRNLFTILFYGLLYIGMSKCWRDLRRGETAKKKRLCRGYGHGRIYHTRACKMTHNNNYPLNNMTPCGCPVAPRLIRPAEAALLSAAILVLPFLPASNLFFYVGFVVAERVLYLPSVGYCMLVGLGYAKLARAKNVLPHFGLAFLLLTYSARTYVRNFAWKDEEALYRSGIEVNPPKSYGNLGSVLSSQGRTAEAEHAFRMALLYRPNMAEVHYNLGILLHGREQYDAAIQSYQLAIHFRPSLALAHLNLGTLLASRGRFEEAEAVLVRCSQLDGSSVKDPRTHHSTRVSALVHLGRMYADRLNYRRAVEAYTKAVDLRPSHYQPQVLYNLLGEALTRLERHEEAEGWFKAALSAKPDHVPAHLTYGKLLAKNKTRLTEAEQWFIKAKKLAPSDPAVYVHFGQFLTELERHGEAASLYLKAAELAPNQYDSVVGAATALRHAGRNQEAERFYRKAVSLRPNESSSHSNLGAMLHLNGKFSEAAASYREALRLDPSDSTTLANLRKLHSLHGSRL